MKKSMILEKVFSPSRDVVVRKIEGETIIIPIVAGIGDLEDDLYALNDTAQAIWEKMNGQKSVHAISVELSTEYQAPIGEIQDDVVGIIEELDRRKIIVCNG